jgi:hypothetical protein
MVPVDELIEKPGGFAVNRLYHNIGTACIDINGFFGFAVCAVFYSPCGKIRFLRGWKPDQPAFLQPKHRHPAATTGHHHMISDKPL